MAARLLVAAGAHPLVASHSALGLGGHTASCLHAPESPSTSHSETRAMGSQPGRVT